MEGACKTLEEAGRIRPVRVPDGMAWGTVPDERELQLRMTLLLHRPVHERSPRSGRQKFVSECLTKYRLKSQ